MKDKYSGKQGTHCNFDCGIANISGLAVFNLVLIQLSNCYILGACPINSETPRY